MCGAGIRTGCLGVRACGVGLFVARVYVFITQYAGRYVFHPLGPYTGDITLIIRALVCVV
jgi:hypothetical protein